LFFFKSKITSKQVTFAVAISWGEKFVMNKIKTLSVDQDFFPLVFLFNVIKKISTAVSSNRQI